MMLLIFSWRIGASWHLLRNTAYWVNVGNLISDKLGVSSLDIIVLMFKMGISWNLPWFIVFTSRMFWSNWVNCEEVLSFFCSQIIKLTHSFACVLICVLVIIDYWIAWLLADGGSIRLLYLMLLIFVIENKLILNQKCSIFFIITVTAASYHRRFLDSCVVL